MKKNTFSILLLITLLFIIGLQIYHMFTNDLFENPVLELIYYALLSVMLVFQAIILKEIKIQHKRPKLVAFSIVFSKIAFIFAIFLTIINLIEIL